MTRRSLSIGVACVAALLTMATAPVFAQEKEETIQKRLAERQATFNDLKSKGKVGETWKGYVEAVKPAYLDEEIDIDQKKVAIKTLLADENADRKAIYAIIAGRESTEKDKVPTEFVAERSAKEKFARAEPGHWLLNDKGKWIQKPARR